MRVEIAEEKDVYDGFLTVRRAELRFEKYDGELSDRVTRESLERGDSVAAVVRDTDSDEVVLTEQFRYPAYAGDGGWLLELPAGMVDEDEEPEAAIRRELEEEVGIRVRGIEHVSTFYTSPGGSSERVWLYYAEVGADDRVGDGGGKAGESEDIRVLRMPVRQAVDAVSDGRLKDAKTIIGLLWLAARH